MDVDACDGQVGAKVDFPPGVGLTVGMRGRFGVEVVAIGIAIDGQAGRSVRGGAGLFGRLFQCEIDRVFGLGVGLGIDLHLGERQESFG